MRLSIALGTYNGQRRLPRQLRSLIAQSRRPDELVAFDDASDDGTAATLRAFAAAADFPVRVVERRENVGVTRNFADAIAACDGDVICCCDQDDVWYPDKLATIEAAFGAGGASSPAAVPAQIEEDVKAPFCRRARSPFARALPERRAGPPAKRGSEACVEASDPEPDGGTSDAGPPAETLSPDLVFSDADLVDDTLRPLGGRLWDSVGFAQASRDRDRRSGGGLLDVLLRFNVVTGAAMAFGASWRDLILPIPPGWVHDYWIAVLLAAAGRATPIDRPLLAYRQHAAQQIGGRRLSLGEQAARARAMDAGYFDRLAGNFETAADRLAGRADGAVVARLAGKADHCRRRARLRAGPGGRAARAGPVLREWASGGYSAYALGARSAAQDLFL